MTNDERNPNCQNPKAFFDIWALNFFRHSSFVLRHFLTLLLATTAHAENWPCWRGPRLEGTSLETNIPIHWSATSNVVWKAELPGSGHASPIIYGDRVFTVTASTESQDRLLLCLERTSGRLLWS